MISISLLYAGIFEMDKAVVATEDKESIRGARI
jgi:hypothetical protein